MKYVKILLISGLLLSVIQNISQAQERKTEFSASAGYAIRVFDTGRLGFSGEASGVYLGLNLYKRNALRLTSDAQVSLNYISEKTGSSDILSVNALYGIRYYLSTLESKTRVFFNTLVGPAVKIEQGDDFTETLLDFGFSAGVFITSKKWVFGVSIDNPTNLIFKVGRRF